MTVTRPFFFSGAISHSADPLFAFAANGSRQSAGYPAAAHHESALTERFLHTNEFDCDLSADSMLHRS